MEKLFVKSRLSALLSRDRSRLKLVPGMGLGAFVFLLLIISGLFINAAYASVGPDNGKAQAKQGDPNAQTGQNVCKPGKGDNPDPNAAAGAGKITAIHGSTLTVQDIKGNTSTTVQTTASTAVVSKITRADHVALSTLKVGDFVGFTGVHNSAGSITANHIVIGIPPQNNPGEPTKKGQQDPNVAIVLGTISAVNGNTLTLQDWDATKKNGGQPVTITIQTTSSTDVMSKVLGKTISLGELKVGTFIQAAGKSDGTTFTATSIVVGKQPAANQCK